MVRHRLDMAAVAGAVKWLAPETGDAIGSFRGALSTDVRVQRCHCHGFGGVCGCLLDLIG